MFGLSKFVLFMAAAAVASAAVLPPNLKRCKHERSSPVFSSCLRDAIEDALPKLKDGNRKIGVIPLEPLEIENIGIDQAETSTPINMKISFSNLKMYGISSAKITNLNSTVVGKKHYLSYEAKIPELTLKSNYKVGGQVLLLPISGQGPCTIWLNNMHTKSYLEGVEFEKKGKTHIRYDSYKLEFYPDDIKFDFQNLFDGNKELGDNMNKVFNENSKEVFKETQGPFQQAFGILFQSLINRVYEKVAIEDIYIFP